MGEDGENHRAFAADVTGKHAADEAADPPTEQRDGDGGTDIGGNLRVLRGIEQRTHCGADGPEKPIQIPGLEEAARNWGGADISPVGGGAAGPTPPPGRRG